MYFGTPKFRYKPSLIKYSELFSQKKDIARVGSIDGCSLTKIKMKPSLSGVPSPTKQRRGGPPIPALQPDFLGAPTMALGTGSY
jgi:hypothetical protein